ncbi:MAG: FAD-binding oxidoreductase [Anaerolineales bacterium]|nr:FAD-binding oxidoreductase [Anaerolineales bacterium]
MSTPSDTYDTVVVGAGLTGALVAHHLAEASQNVVVLEAKSAPGDAAAKSVEVALLGTPEPYAALQTRLGVDVGRRIWELTRRNLDLLTAVLQKVHQQPIPVGSLRLAADAAEVALLQESATLLRQDLYAAEIDDQIGSTDEIGKAKGISSANLTDHGYQIGLRTAEDLAFDPAALTTALLDHANITIEYETEVQAIRPANESATRTAETTGKPTYTIWARKHYLHTQNVILANGAHAVRLHPGLVNIISPLAMHTIDLRSETALPTPLVINRGQVIIQAREMSWRMVGWSDTDEDTLPMLAAIAQQLCPNAFVLARHSWWAARSADGLPVVGQAPDMPNVYIVNGLGPCGWSWVGVAVDRLVGALLHNEKIGPLALDRFAPA